MNINPFMPEQPKKRPDMYWSITQCIPYENVFGEILKGEIDISIKPTALEVNCKSMLYFFIIQRSMTDTGGTLSLDMLTHMLLVANFRKKMMQNIWKMTETLAYGYSSKSTQRELSNEYQHDRV